MDGKKVYSIKINGVQESIDAVLALNKMLNELETRIQSLEKKNIKINTGGSSSSKGTSALSEEAKLEKQIEQIDAKRKAYSKEIYQNYLAAKDVLDETVKDQKQIAAQERLQANNYSNTMQGLKEELKDLKTVMQTTDLGDEKFGEMSQRAGELTEKLKQLEEAYGQFGRNVGNYQSAFDAISKVSVNMGGVVKEFDNLKQATKAIRDEMGRLEYNGQQDTKMYKQLEKELEKVSKAQLRLNSAMKDAKASSKAMDDLLDTMESFVALSQVSQGLSAFFGFDDSEVQRSIQKLVALQNVLQGIEKIRQQMNTGEGIGGWIAKGSNSVDKFVMKLTGAQKRMGMLVKDTRQATLAVQGLSTALKVLSGIGIAAAFMAISAVVEKLIEKFNKWKDGGYQAGTATDVLNKQLEAFNEKAKLLKQIDLDRYFQGLITNEQYATEATKDLTNQLNILLDSFGKLKDKDFSKKSVSILGGIQIGYDKDADAALAKAEARFDVLAQKITNFEAKGEEASDKMKREFQELGEGLSKHLLFSIQQTMETAKKEVDGFGKVSDETKRKIAELNYNLRYDEHTNGILANIDKFSQKGQFYVNRINAIKDALLELGNTMGMQIPDASMLKQLEIDAMKDGLAKQREQIELNRKKELANFVGNKAMEKAINAKYDREILNAEKAASKEMAGVYSDLEKLKIELLDEGWEKQKRELEHERDERIRAIRESEKLVAERTALVQEIYRKRIIDAEKKWAADRIQVYKDLYQEIQELNRQTFSMEIENSNKNVKNRENKDKLNAGQSLINGVSYKDTKTLEEYYKRILEIEKKAAEEREEIRKADLEKQREYDEEEEKLRHEKAIDAVNSEYAEKLKQGLIDQKQYDKLIEDENDAHTARMNAIDKKYNADSQESTQEALDDKYNAYRDYYNNLVDMTCEKLSKVNEKLSKSDRPLDSGFGLNIGAVTKNLDKVKEQYNEIKKEIINKKIELGQALNEKKITPEQFMISNNALDEYLKQIDTQLETAEQKQAQSVEKFVAKLNQYIQAIGQSIQQIMSAVWDYQDYQFEKEQNELDKWNEKLDKALDKQEQIVEEHKNNVNSIEDELATARGDRRQHLIDQLNAEISAQRAAQKEEQRIKKEQEAAKKKEEALEKKRREAEYKRNVMQAFVSWHLSIANGLATQPFLPVGIAMGALATTLGAIQYALVKSQKPYAKGGQLDGGVAQGKRHRDGGIPVLGGRASIEGGEFITNRQTTANNVDLLEFVNSKHRKLNIDDFIDFYSSGKAKKNIISMSPRTKFADGGQIPTLDNTYSFDDRLLEAFEKYADRPSVVSVVDINNKQDDVKRVQALAGLNV